MDTASAALVFGIVFILAGLRLHAALALVAAYFGFMAPAAIPPARRL